VTNRFLPFLWALLIPLQSPAQDVGELSSVSLQVQEIRCSGNTQTSCDFIRNHLHLQAGDALDEQEVRNAELRLSALRNFDSVAIHLEKGAQRGQVIVVIDVTENSPIAMEWVGGGSYRMEEERIVLGGRIAHQNLFGEGKYADLTANAGVPLGGPGHNEFYDITARYADPALYGRRWFGIASVGWQKHDVEDQFGNFSRGEWPLLDVTLGWRFADFSYLTSGLVYRPGSELLYGRWQRDGTFGFGGGADVSTFNVSYGWNSEDDLLFPTQGSTLQIGAALDFGGNIETHARVSRLQFRKTWSWAGAYWTFAVGGDPAPEYLRSISEDQFFAVTYARPLRAGDNIRRARWYIEPGAGNTGWAPGSRHIDEVGVKVGFRADTRAFGVIDLYFLATVDENK
jgi:outer membrane translocation and assembly module TamA